MANRTWIAENVNVIRNEHVGKFTPATVGKPTRAALLVDLIVTPSRLIIARGPPLGVHGNNRHVRIPMTDRRIGHEIQFNFYSTDKICAVSNGRSGLVQQRAGVVPNRWMLVWRQVNLISRIKNAFGARGVIYLRCF
jgi:hypothetical protein